MSEYEVSITLKAVKVSAQSPGEAVTKAAELVAKDVNGNTATASAVKLDRITVTGLARG
jgi:hypothetical protein